MSNVLILGANGYLARVAIDLFLKQTTARLTLYLRNARRLKNIDPRRARVIEGDVLDTGKLKEAMAGQDVVHANLAGEMEGQDRSIVKAMDETGVRRLIFISSMGIYDEVPSRSGIQRTSSKLQTSTTRSCEPPGLPMRTRSTTRLPRRASLSREAACRGRALQR